MSDDDTLCYREFDAPAPLAAYVRCFWRMRGAPRPISPPETIIPDGCSELVLNLGDAFIRHTDTGSHRHPPILIAGQITRSISIQRSGRVDLWGIRFHPWGAAPLLNFVASEMRNQLVSLGDVAADVEHGLATVAEEKAMRLSGPPLRECS